ncbi:hypothetical protein DYB36_011291 [Aphanomyces astaci]|uniref:Serine aminopeptidase S33 domain-containing protein n=1 Tax=Aphanomyces astaci TaxID=112090 RepID=A0A397BM24_APHAT|nr:hypothetical protein DYB36_011291 [Aphanomyces astaci]
MEEVESEQLRSTGTFTGPRGHILHYNRVLPPATVSRCGLIVFLHGLGEYSSRYTNLFDELARHGWVVYAHDYVGHGLSEGDRMYFDRFDDVVADAESFIGFAKSDSQSTKPCVLLGNSLGGLVANFVVLRQTQLVDAVILVAPGLDVPRTWLLHVQSAVASVLSAVFPKWRIVPGGDRNNLTSDRGILDAIDSDPLLNKLPMSCRVGAELLGAFTTFSQRKHLIQLPVLVILGSEEKMVSTASIHSYVQDIASQDKELQEFDGMGHLMLLESTRHQVFQSVGQWLHHRYHN